MPPINWILALNHRIGYNTTAIELLLPTWKAGVIDLRKRVRAEGRTHCWRERASLGPPCSSRHRVEPQARISLDRPKLQSQSRPSGKVLVEVSLPRSRSRRTSSVDRSARLCHGNGRRAAWCSVTGQYQAAATAPFHCRVASARSFRSADRETRWR